MPRPRTRLSLIFSLGLLPIGLLGTAPAQAQFDEVEVPPQLASLDFMLGDWTVDGEFRTPDFVGDDRLLWYFTRGEGVTRFDGRAWTSFPPGGAVSDSIRARVETPTEPFRFSTPMSVRTAQDGFVLLIDEGRTSGTTMIYIDPASEEWVSIAIHAPTGSLTRSTAPVGEGTPVFSGSGVDRRGERIFRRSYTRHSSDHFTVRIDISFDAGETWIDGQSVQQVRRR